MLGVLQRKQSHGISIVPKIQLVLLCFRIGTGASDLRSFDIDNHLAV
jgi:hypothetical protein